MPIYNKDGLKIYFIHIPKTGGSSINELFLSSGFRRIRRRREKNDCTTRHHHRELILKYVNLSDMNFIFTVIREPLDRLTSEYYMRHRKGRLRHWSKKMFEKYKEDPCYHDNHIRPQNEFIVPGTVVYRYEDGLDNVILDINKRFNLKLEGLPRLKASVRNKPTRTQLIEEDMLAIQSFYRKDYEMFNYPLLVEGG